MKLLFIGLICCLKVVFGRNQVRCPIPHYYEVSQINEDVCNSFSACEWLTDSCLLKHSHEYGYNSEQTGDFYTLRHNSDLTLFGNDIKELRFEIFYYGSSHLRVKISDPNNNRYEVPVPLNLPEPSATPPDDALYEVQVSTGDTFDFRVIRKQTQSTIFDTSVASAFVYDDQFLQFFTALPSSYAYGFGENIHKSFRHPFDGETFVVFAKDQPPSEGPVNLYGSHPIYHCIEDDEGNSHGTFIFNSNAMEYSFGYLSDSTPGFLYNTVGGILDIHFFLGPTVEDINKQYAQVIGLPMMPPYWSLGFQLSRFGYFSLDAMQEAVNATKRENIPQDVQYGDIDYFDGGKDFTLDEENYAGLPDYVRYLKTTGVKFVTIVDPGIVVLYDTYPPAERGKAADAFIKWPTESDIPEDQCEGCEDFIIGYVYPENKTMFPDFLYQPAQDWWIEENKLWHETIEFDGLWIDKNEPSNFGTNKEQPHNWPEGMDPWSLKCYGNKFDEPPYPTKAINLGDTSNETFPQKTLCMNSVQRLGSSDEFKTYNHYDVHSLYGWSESEPTYRANFASTGKRPLVISRSTFPGSGKHAGHWLGDNYSVWRDLKLSIIGMFEFNMFGMPYIGADICGYFYNATEELCTRWMCLGAFYPFSRNHNRRDNIPQDPGQWPTTAEASRNCLSIRYTLLPYLYTLFAHSHMDGSSVIRPLLNQYPTDIIARDIDDVFLWGSDVLIAPILERRSDSRIVYMPAGRWYYYSYLTLATEGEGDYYYLPLSVTDIGVFLRGGSIIPTKQSQLTTELQRSNPFELLVVLDENEHAFGDLFWDDGVTEGTIEAGSYYYTTMNFTQNVFELKCEKPFEKLDSELILSRVTVLGYPSEPSDVTVNNTTTVYRYDAQNFILRIFLNVTINKPVVINIHNNNNICAKDTNKHNMLHKPTEII